MVTSPDKDGKAPQVLNNPLRSPLAKLIMVLVSVLLPLALIEAVFSSMETDYHRELFFLREGIFVQYDPTFGWAMTPERERLYKRPEFEVWGKSNSLGMRYHEVKEKTGFRVAVIGDSFTWGDGVEEKQRFTDITERELGVDVLNFGMNGYGMTQYYLMLDRVLPHRPDLVIIAFCLSNDFSETVTNYGHEHYHPYAALEDGELKIKGLPVPDTRGLAKTGAPWLLRFATGRYLYLRIPELWSSWADTPHYIGAPAKAHSIDLVDSDIYDNPDSKEVQQMKLLLVKLLQEAKSKVNAGNAELALYPVLTKRELENSRALDLMRDVSHQAGIIFIEAAPIDKALFYPVDGHWNAKGHEKAAADIMPVIKNYRDAAP